MPEGVLVGIVVVIALAFDFTNGFHDTANSIAAAVSTHALSPRAAVTMASVMNFIGAFITLKVAATIGSGVANPQDVTLMMILAALLGAIAWNLITWRYGLPSSSSYALIGGLIGAVIVGLGFSHVNWHSVLTKMVIPLVVSPVIGFVGAYLLMLIIFWAFRKAAPRPANRGFRFAQIFSSAFVAFSHGTNDAQKTMGVITLALISGGFLAAKPFTVPLWVIASAGLAIALGTYVGGWRIIKTVGTKLYKIEPAQGFAAQTVAALVIEIASHYGFPVSTTHVVTGSIMGAGSTERLSSVRWGVASNIVLGWIVTIPAAAGMAGLIYVILSLIAR
jgi:inorganic phosphate transporter, PiT family